MNSVRHFSRQPLVRCLNAPLHPKPQLRQFSRTFPGQGTHTLNDVSVHRAEATRRAYYTRRRNWLALGAALSMIAPMILVRMWDVSPAGEKGGKESESVMDFITPKPTQTDSPRRATEEFQGKKVIIAAGDKVLAAPADADNPSIADAGTIELVETGTSYVPYFPKTIKLPTSPESADIQSEAEYTLIGLGIRKVSFLRVQVYVVGLYVKNSSLSKLQNHLINTVNPTASALIPGEKEDLRTSLLDGDKSNEIWETILAKQSIEGVDMVLRIVPTRGTDFNHLRDGLMRGIASRTDEVRKKQADLLRQQAAESKQIALPKPVDETEFADDSFGLAMKDFKALFQGRGSAPKGSIILLTRDKSGTLGMMYQALKKTNKGEKPGEVTRLGEVKDERVGRLVWLLYLGGKNVSSEDARKNIVDGCLHLVERPVGTVEGMVQ